jgi:hypothetical protein
MAEDVHPLIILRHNIATLVSVAAVKLPRRFHSGTGDGNNTLRNPLKSAGWDDTAGRPDTADLRFCDWLRAAKSPGRGSGP